MIVIEVNEVETKYVHAYTHICTHVYIYIYTYEYLYMYIYMFVCTTLKTKFPSTALSRVARRND